MDSDSAEMVSEVQNKVILHWNCRDLSEFPEVIRLYGSHIQEIYLKWNKLTTLPPWIVELLNITNLYLYGNLIRDLPQEIGGMVRLTVLDLSDNKLEGIPACLGNLANLKSLVLNNNSIKSLPPEMNRLQNLEILSIAGNELIALPEWVGSLPRLKELNVDSNHLQEVPNRLTTSPELSLVSVCSNRSLLLRILLPHLPFQHYQKQKVIWRNVLTRLRFLPMNGFVSSPAIKFDANVHLNYLSYPLLLQLIAQFHNLLSHERRSALGYGCFKESHESSAPNRNIRLSIRGNTLHDQSDQIIELPRQLLSVYKSHESVVVSLWELSLRKVYSDRYKHTLSISASPLSVNVQREPVVEDYRFEQVTHCMNYTSYNLLLNGPASICVSYQCQQPIFTEAWVVTGVNHHTESITTVALCCCKRCAVEFVAHSSKIVILDWDFAE